MESDAQSSSVALMAWLRNVQAPQAPWVGPLD